MRVLFTTNAYTQRNITKALSRSSGFTLIELLVVISVMAIIGTISLASFGNFNRSSSLKQTAAQLASFLSDAKSRSLSQLKPSSCTGSLDGYTVDFCLATGGSCTSVDSYVLSTLCSGTKTTITTKKLPSAVHFTSSGTTSQSYTFATLTGGVNGAGTLAISGYGSTAKVIVSPAGAISVQ